MSNNYVYLFIWQTRCQDDSILSLGDLITETKTSICLKSTDLHIMDIPPKGDELYTLRKVSLFTYFRERKLYRHGTRKAIKQDHRVFLAAFNFLNLCDSLQGINIFLRGRLNSRFT